MGQLIAGCYFIKANSFADAECTGYMYTNKLVLYGLLITDVA